MKLSLSQIHKSSLVLLFFTCFLNSSKAQVFFKEDFSAGIPSSYLIVDGDGLVPNSTVISFFPNAWTANVVYGNTDMSAISTSWYTPNGTSDDWMITRSILIPNQAEPVYLTWDAQSLDIDRRDKYAVYVSKTTQSVNGCLENAAVYSTEEESSVLGGTKRKVDMSAFKGLTVYIGFRNNSTNKFILSIDNITLLTPSATDGGVVEFVGPKSGCGFSSTENIKVKIVNDGFTTLNNFGVTYKLNGQITANETVSTPIAAGDTLLYTFNTKANLTNFGQYSLKAYTNINGDVQYKENDTSLVFFESYDSFDLSTNLNMGFELNEPLVGWKIEDANRDGIVWGITDLLSRTGTYSLRKSGSGETGDNDWLISPCLDLLTNTTYTLEYYYKVFDINTPCNLEVAMGLEQKGSALVIPIIQNVTPIDDKYRFVSVSFKVPQNATYHIGFHASSVTGSSSLRLDDIVFKTGLSTGIEEERTEPSISIYPNPSSGVVNIKSIDEIKSITILDLFGKKVFEDLKVNAKEFSQNLPELSNGMYSICIQTKDQMIQKKIEIIK